jgi:hypothetical protein
MKRGNLLMLAVVVVATAATLTGCDGLMTPDPIKTKPEDAQALVDHITYVKDKHGICYAVASVDRISTGGHLAENVMFTAVPCLQVGL